MDCRRIDILPPDDLSTRAARLYGAWFRLTNPLAGGVVPDWQILEPATRVLWEAIAREAMQDHA